MLRPPDVLENRVAVESPRLSKRKSARCVIDLKSDRVIYIPEGQYSGSKKHKHFFKRKSENKLPTHKKKKKKKRKKKFNCCVVS